MCLLFGIQTTDYLRQEAMNIIVKFIEGHSVEQVRRLGISHGEEGIQSFLLGLQ